MRLSSVAACAMSAMSSTSWTLPAASIAKPVWRQAITSVWSPKIERPWQASARAETWKTVGMSSPAILYMFGIISSRPWEAVNVVVRAPVVSAPCRVPAAPPSDSISITLGMLPQRFLSLRADHSSHHSAIGEDGVMG